jgi:hypothetical protein
VHTGSVSAQPAALSFASEAAAPALREDVLLAWMIFCERAGVHGEGGGADARGEQHAHEHTVVLMGSVGMCVSEKMPMYVYRRQAFILSSVRARTVCRSPLI